MQPLDARLPARRVTELVTTEASSDLLVYDQSSAAIHTLNDVTATVWRALETSKAPSQVAVETGLSEDVIRAAATKLSDAGLLDGEIQDRVSVGQSRRDLLKKAAIGGAVAVPILMSTTAVGAQQAQSCDNDGCSYEDALAGVSCGLGPVTCLIFECKFIPGTQLPACLP